jgi:hypothetical protein
VEFGPTADMSVIFIAEAKDVRHHAGQGKP